MSYALVTGAAGDLGRAACAALEHDGWQVVGTDVDDADVTDPAAVEALLSRHGVPEAVVAAAGIQGSFAPVHEQDAPTFAKVLAVNVSGLHNVLRATSRAMIAAGRGGSFVALASMAARGAPNMSAYSASKAAVVGLVRAAALDLAPHGIRVNAVSPAFIGPGAMWTNQLAGQAATPSPYYGDAPTEVADQMLSRIPLRRIGRPEEVADVIAFLAGPRSSYVTGVDLEVAGGAV